MRARRRNQTYRLSFQPESIDGAVFWRVGGLPYRVHLRVGRRPDRRLACMELRVSGGDEITARGLLRIPLGQILDGLAVFAFAPREGLSQDLTHELDRLQLSGAWDDMGPPPPRRSAITPAVLEQLATEYRAAVADPETARSPVKALAERRHQSEQTVRRLLRICRDDGLLGPAIHGKAGEVRPPRRKR